MKRILLLSCVIVTFGIILSLNREPVVAPIVEAPVEVPSTPDSSPIPVPPKPTYEDAIASINEAELKSDVYFLASEELEGRMSGKKGNIAAAEFIKKKYESFGLDTEYQKFNIQRMNPGPKKETGDNFTQNVYAWVKGKKYPDQIVIIGAHMDHIGYGPSMSRWGGGKIHPGADDNASGTACLMAIAKAYAMLSDDVQRTVVFQSYSAEEMGLLGARYYCDNPTFPKDTPSLKKHIFMANMDMVGWLRQGHGAAMFTDGYSSPDIAKIISSLDNKYPFAQRITSRGSGGSDHACFYNKGVPVVFMHTGGHAHYHTPTDTADKINYDGMEQIAKYVFELTWKVVQDESIPKFDTKNFKPMEYIHDHGHKDIEFPKE